MTRNAVDGTKSFREAIKRIQTLEEALRMCQEALMKETAVGVASEAKKAAALALA